MYQLHKPSQVLDVVVSFWLSLFHMSWSGWMSILFTIIVSLHNCRCPASFDLIRNMNHRSWLSI